jgi:hypothetical protein
MHECRLRLGQKFALTARYPHFRAGFGERLGQSQSVREWLTRGLASESFEQSKVSFRPLSLSLSLSLLLLSSRHGFVASYPKVCTVPELEAKVALDI